MIDAHHREAGHIDPRVTAFFEALMSTAPLGLGFVDRELRYLRVNAALAEMDGLSVAEHLGRPVSDVLPHLGQTTVDALRRVIATGESVTQREVVTRTAGGPERRWRTSAFPVRDDAGEVVGVGIVVEETTEARRLERERAELVVQLEQMTRTDPLTGVGNRRAWDEALRRELARAEREQRSICIALIDLDHFKEFNDTYGHIAGDNHLGAVARAWRAELRGGDLIVRYGGEEFALMLPGATLESAVATAERLGRAVPRGETSSAGVACSRPGETAEGLLMRADRALYEAKAAGRNRVLAAP